MWSERNWELDQPWYSGVTGKELPGKWVGWGELAVGPDPADNVVWSECCDRAVYERLEECPNVPCREGGRIVCRAASECSPGNFER